MCARGEWCIRSYLHTPHTSHDHHTSHDISRHSGLYHPGVLPLDIRGRRDFSRFDPCPTLLFSGSDCLPDARFYTGAPREWSLGVGVGGVGGGGGGLRAHERVAGEYLLLMGTRRIHCAAFGFCFTVTHMTRVLSLVLPCSTRGSRVVEL